MMSIFLSFGHGQKVWVCQGVEDIVADSGMISRS
jgi:hypothetical protein